MYEKHCGYIYRRRSCCLYNVILNSLLHLSSESSHTVILRSKATKNLFPIELPAKVGAVCNRLMIAGESSYRTIRLFALLRVTFSLLLFWILLYCHSESSYTVILRSKATKNLPNPIELPAKVGAVCNRLMIAGESSYRTIRLFALLRVTFSLLSFWIFPYCHSEEQSDEESSWPHRSDPSNVMTVGNIILIKMILGNPIE